MPTAYLSDVLDGRKDHRDGEEGVMKGIEEIIASNKVMIIEKSRDGFSGMIFIRGWEGSVIASWGGGWDHVSVAPKKLNKVPTWDDMCAIKELFFKDDEAVIQVHPPKDEYVNNMPNCLHLWRANDKDMILPPSFMVGIRKGQTQSDVMREAEEYYKEHGYEW